jgi:hypothetical protein
MHGHLGGTSKPSEITDAMTPEPHRVGPHTMKNKDAQNMFYGTQPQNVYEWGLMQS